MSFAEFEEKTFEQLFTNELLSRRTLFFPPGQVLENTLGFDVALFTRRRKFWRLFADSSFLFPWRRGIEIDPLWWPGLPDDIDHFPSFRFNLFIQYKRPEYLNSPQASEWNSWRRLYYRYDLDQNQQNALLNLANQVGHQALIIHASPVFHTYADLWNHAKRREILSFSNFATVQDLQGHLRYSYADPGHNGVGHSEPSRIEGRDLFELMNSLIAGKTETTNNQFLMKLGRIADTILSEGSYYSEQYLEIKKESEFNGVNNYNDVFWVMSLFNYFTNVKWMIGTE